MTFFLKENCRIVYEMLTNFILNLDLFLPPTENSA